MYEPAAGPGPLWRVDAARTLFVGPLDYNAPHQHGAPVFLSSLGGPFGVRIADGPWRACEAAMVPAGVVHELRVGMDPIAVLYVEPSVAGADAFRPLMRDVEETGAALVGRSNVISLVRRLHEDRDSAAWAGEALDDVLDFGGRRARRSIDPRVAAAIGLLEANDRLSLADAALAVSLSPSRLQHLFAEEAGVPFRRYRAWTRMRRAIGAVIGGANLTEAAHAAGFSDQPHFAHDFRRTFGAPASFSLTGVRR
ncbi:helix-turn-helix transcriptional regulator [Chenggangzhangella methanolivorans]|uniref:helix-turn-helix transcriptional regulator n=1 Tax=Chenggangzhangella methanolivorans TaxID=1437009 RepID=UPI00366DF24F